MYVADVIIVGGGPSGAACGWVLKKNGIDCIILDRQRFPRIKLCAGWVPPGLWQDLLIKPQFYPHGLNVFHRLYTTIKGVTIALPTLQYAIRRIEFDEWMLQRSEVPVKLHHVRHLSRENGYYIVDQEYKAPYIVGAGGTHCPVYRALFSEISPRNPADLIVTLEEEFPYPIRDQRCQLWFLEQGLPGYAWYVPKANGYVNVGVGGKVAILKRKGDHIQRHWAILVDKLQKNGIVTDYQYTPKGHSYYLRQSPGKVQVDNAYIVGDAAALASRDLGEGITVAIKSGIRAAEAIINGTEYSVQGIRKNTLGYEWFRLPWLQ
jgi:flavin-dependent dehydrogenase